MLEEWHVAAACRGVDPELFFADSTTSYGKWMEAEAKAECRICPVRRRCLEDAMRIESAAPGSRSGIFGGLNAQQRKNLHATRLKRARKAAA